MRKAIAIVFTLLGIGSITVVNANGNLPSQSLISHPPQIAGGEIEKIDLNSADLKTIADAINGIGPKRALAIVKYRDTHGPFATIEELANVKGISSKFVENRIEELNEKFTI